MESLLTSKIPTPEKLINRHLRFYTPLAMILVSLLIAVNLIAQKLIPLGKHLVLTSGDLVYPLIYLLSVTITEVYGYALSRRIIWLTFICSALVSAITSLSIILPGAEFWHNQTQYALILGNIPRILIASLSAFWLGEFIGAYLMAKLKIFMAGKRLWLRALIALLISQLIDSFMFTVVAFYSSISWNKIILLSFSTYCFKLIYQLVLTPLVCFLANYLKVREQIDIFDRETDFNPFRFGSG